MAVDKISKYGYKAGDSVNLNNDSRSQIMGCFVGKTRLRFIIPLPKEILASTVSLSGSGTFTYRPGDGTYTTFSLSDLSAYTFTPVFCGVAVQFDWSADQVPTNNTLASVQINNGLTLNFS